MRKLFTYLVFLYVSIALHMVLLQYPWQRVVEPPPPEPLQMDIGQVLEELQEAIQDLAEEEPQIEPTVEAPPAPPPPPATTPAAEPIPPAPAPVELARKFDLPEPPPVEDEQPESEPKVTEQPEPPPVEDKQAISLVEPPPPQPTEENLPEVIDLAQLPPSDYREFVRHRHEVEGQAFIPLAIQDLSWPLIQEIQRRYGLLTIAYPATNQPQFYFWIDIERGRIQRSREFSYLATHFANLIIEVPSSIREMRLFRSRISRESGIPANRFQLGLVLPTTIAHYLLWKETEACRRAGLDPKQDVQHMKGTFTTSADGTWVFVVTEIALSNGRVMKVRL